MFSDTYEGKPYQQGNSIQMVIHPKEEARAREILTALEDRWTSHYASSEDGLEPLIWARKRQVWRYFPSERPRRVTVVLANRILLHTNKQSLLFANGQEALSVVKVLSNDPLQSSYA